MNLASDFIAEDWHESYENKGYVHIPNFLSVDTAEQLFQHLVQQQQWNISCQQNSKHTDMDFGTVETWSAEQKNTLTQIIHQQARNGFQYYYKTLPVYDIFHRKLIPGHFSHKVFEFLNSKKVLEAFRIITNLNFDFVDAQATCFSAGHFLTKHDDNIPDKNRVAAYVLNLTKGWREDWGGQLQFFDQHGHVEQAYSPTFNALNIFSVPKQHSVNYVTPFAQGNRYSITGWLREGPDPGA